MDLYVPGLALSLLEGVGVTHTFPHLKQNNVDSSMSKVDDVHSRHVFK